MIHLTNGAYTDGTSFHGVEFSCDPLRVIGVFGRGGDGDRCKTIQTWVFEFKGDIFTLYDYKENATTYWTQPRVTLHIGSRVGEDKEREFKEALAKTLGMST